MSFIIILIKFKKMAIVVAACNQLKVYALDFWYVLCDKREKKMIAGKH